MIQLSRADGIEGRIGQSTGLPAPPENGKGPPEVIISVVAERRGDHRRHLPDCGRTDSQRFPERFNLYQLRWRGDYGDCN